MKILHTVEFYHPSIGGMQEVVRQISERLVSLGHSVTVATTKLRDRNCHIMNGVNIEEFSIKGNFVRGMSGDLDRYRNYVINNNFDIITNFAAQQWATDALISHLDQIKSIKIFVPTGFSAIHDKNYSCYYKLMKIWMKQYDVNIFLSECYQDINFARENNIDNHIVIPNGAAKDEFLDPEPTDIRRKLGIPVDDFLILNVGSHTGIKGHAESIKILSKSKLNNTTFLLVGNKVHGGCAKKCFCSKIIYNCSLTNIKDRNKIKIRTLTREETIAAYKSADLFLFPSNLECSPLVLFESMASKTPFLVTNVGNSKEIISNSNCGLLLPTYYDKYGYAKADIEKSANLLKYLYDNVEVRNSMAEQGYNAWINYYTWEKIVKKYEELYKRLLGESV